MERCSRTGCGLVVSHLARCSVEEVYRLLRLWHRSCGIVLARYFLNRFTYPYIRMVLELPRDLDARRAAACLALHNLSGLAEWSYWLPAFRGTYTHCQAIIISSKLTGDPTALSELGRICGEDLMKETSPDSGEYVFEVPKWGPALSFITVLSEYAIAESLPCPHCGGGLTFVRQMILPDLSGDVLIFRCESCGKEIRVTFKFREPKPGKDFIEEWALLALMELLVEGSYEPVPDYMYFNSRLTYMMRGLETRGDYSKFLHYVNLLFRMLYYSLKLVRPRACSARQNLDHLFFKFLKLLISAGNLLNTKLPEVRDWRDALRECVATVASQYVQTWKQPSRRHPAYPKYVRYGRPGIVLVIDRNAAGYARAVRTLSSYLEALLREFNMGTYEHEVIIADNEAVEARGMTLKEISDALPQPQPVAGEGGTVLSPALRKALEYGGMDKALIVLTDGRFLDFEEVYEVADEASQDFAACAVITTDTPPLLNDKWLLGRICSTNTS